METTVINSENQTAPTESAVATAPAKRKGRAPSPNTMISFWAIDGKPINHVGKPSIEELKNRRRVTIQKIVGKANYNPEVHGYGEVDPADALEITRRQNAKEARKVKATAPVMGATMPAPSNSETVVSSLTPETVNA